LQAAGSIEPILAASSIVPRVSIQRKNLAQTNKTQEQNLCRLHHAISRLHRSKFWPGAKPRRQVRGNPRAHAPDDAVHEPGKTGRRAGADTQQVQKYEKGTNRISASRLQQISNILQVPV
jgi:hypothetical protein